MDCNLPIGVFDSGVGGLTVFKQLRKLMPNENLIYFGDTKRNPYGPRPEAEIKEFIAEILTFMADKKVKLAVAACNTITVLMDQVKRQYPFEVIGMSKGARSAVNLSNTRRVGVIATEATIRSGKHAAEITALDRRIQVVPKACPQFAPLVEAEQFSGDLIEQAALEYLTPLKQANVDVVILGCTHYPLLSGVINKVLGPVRLFDPAEETAMEAKAYLEAAGQLKTEGKGASSLYFSADVERAKRIASQIINIDECQFGCVDVARIMAAG